MTVGKIFLLLLLFAVIFSFPVFSSDRVAVLDFQAKDVKESDALSIADLFRSDLVAEGKFIVLERSNMQAILNEHELQMTGMTDSASATEIGNLLSVNFLFTGNLSKFGSKYILVIDKINVNTGQIEKSVKKDAVNINSFFELSAQAAQEMSGSEVTGVRKEGDALSYDDAALNELFSELGIFQLGAIEVDKKRMQASDVPLRREVYEQNSKSGALLSSGLNLVSLGIAGSFQQGFDEYAYLSIGTTAFFAASMILDMPPALKITSGALFGASWLGSLITPFVFESFYNSDLRDKLLVF